MTIGTEYPDLGTTILVSTVEAVATHWPDGTRITDADREHASLPRRTWSDEPFLVELVEYRRGWAVIWEDESDREVTIWTDQAAAVRQYDEWRYHADELARDADELARDAAEALEDAGEAGP